MRGNYKIGIVFLAVAILLIAILEANEKQPLDWRKTFNSKDKIPFGTYVLRHELENIFDENQSILSIREPLYTYLEKQKDITDKELIFIGSYFDPGKTAVKSLVEFVARGNTAFIAAEYLSKELIDTLVVSYSRYESYYAKDYESSDSTRFELARTGMTATYDRVDMPRIFEYLNADNSTILGYLLRPKHRLPNFIRVRHGKGELYLHLGPDVFSNYYLLQEETFPIAYEALHYLKGHDILWYENKYDEVVESDTPIRYILSQPALRNGWYLLLVTLTLFLIFKSRREQGAIPIVKPEENLSVAFAESIGSLYYESGQPGNMVEKKINYFLYNLRKDFRLEETEINSEDFRKEVTSKLKLSREEVDTFFDRLQYYISNKKIDKISLKHVQNIIEDFKEKIYIQ